MPRGYPDWFGQPQFPKYGAIKSITGETIVERDVLTNVFSITGKGKIDSGRAWYSPYLGFFTAYFNLKIDGVSIWSNFIDHMKQLGCYAGSGQALFLLSYDSVLGLYTIGIRGDITFETSFILQTKQYTNTDLTCHYDVLYTLIE